MQKVRLAGALLGTALMAAGCSNGVQRLDGDAAPAGAATFPSSAAASAPPAPPTSLATPASSTAPATPTAPSDRSPSARPTAGTAKPTSPATGRTSIIRRTDWPNVTLQNLRFLNLGDLRFRNGEASSGALNCTMLPGGARPGYADYLTEEPANSPVTEDALILIECGSDGRQQALIPVKLGFDQKTREAIGFITADPSTGPASRMTFTSYAIEQGVIVTTVKKTNGDNERRRYRFDGGINWKRI